MVACRFSVLKVCDTALDLGQEVATLWHRGDSVNATVNLSGENKEIILSDLQKSGK